MTGKEKHYSILKALLLNILSILLASTAYFSAYAESERFFDSSVFAGRPGYTYNKFDKTWEYTGNSGYWVDSNILTLGLTVSGDEKDKELQILLNVGYIDRTYNPTEYGLPEKIQFLFNDQTVASVQLPFSGTLNHANQENIGLVILGENAKKLLKVMSNFDSLSVKVIFANRKEVYYDFSESDISDFFAEDQKGNDSFGYTCGKLLETDFFNYYNKTHSKYSSYFDDSKYIAFGNEELFDLGLSTRESAETMLQGDNVRTKSDSETNDYDRNSMGGRKNGLFTYRIKGNGTASIIDYEWDKSSEDIYIPTMLDGYAVTAIEDEAFANGKQVNENDVLISIPDSVTIIGEKAFYNSPVSTVSIPASVKAIGKAAFAYCDITQFIVDQQQPNYATIDGVLYDKRNRTLLAHPQKKSITSRIPEGIQSIGEYAFSGMTIGQDGSTALCLTDILPSTLTKIEAHAFENCTLYYSTNNDQSGVIYYNSNGNEMNWLPANVTLVDEYAFAGCTFKCKSYSSPESIVIGEKIEEIGDYAFSGCRFYDGFDFDLVISRSDIERIGKSAFASSVMYSNENEKMKVRLQLPEAIEEIDENAFFETHPVCIREGTEIRSVSEAAFRNSIVYSEMKKEKYQDAIPISLSIPGKMKTIPSSAFAYRLDDDLNKVEKIDIQDGVRKIGDSAFAGRKSLKAVSIPMTVTEIGDQAFTGCQSIKEVSVPESVTEIGDNAFERQYVTLIVKEDSYAALWASENGYNFRYEEKPDNLDWLNSDIH